MIPRRQKKFIIVVDGVTLAFPDWDHAAAFINDMWWTWINEKEKKEETDVKQSDS